MKQRRVFIVFVRIGLIVIQLDTFFKISYTPEVTIFLANIFIFLKIIYQTSASVWYFSSYMCNKDLTKVFVVYYFILIEKLLKECLMLTVL